MLRLVTFGSPALLGPDGPVLKATDGHRLPLALLAILGHGSRRGVPRERLLPLLWPDVPAAKASHRLTQLLYALRRDLGLESPVLGSGELRLNPAVIRADTQDFDDLVPGNPESAVALYQGPFLDGFVLHDGLDFERWHEETRSRYAERHRALLDQLAAGASARGARTEAAAWLRRRSELDPLDCEAAARCVDATAAAGERLAALEYAERFIRRLREDYDEDPAPVLRSALVRLREREAHVTLLVLPLEAHGSADDAQALADGLSDELTTLLGRLDGLRVVARTSAFALHAMGLDLPESARRAEADLVLEGSVTIASDRARLRLRLVDGRDGLVRWSDALDADLSDLFDLQDLLGRRVAAAIAAATGRAATEAPPQRQPVRSADAYADFLRGRHAALQRTPESMRQAITHFERVITLDETYAPAYAGLADAWCLLGFGPFGDAAPHDVMPRARVAAARAALLDPSLSEAQRILGTVAFLYDWDDALAQQTLERALALDPMSPLALCWLALLHGAHARWDDALPLMARARRLDPGVPSLAVAHANLLNWSGRSDEAKALLRRALQDSPGHPQLGLLLLCMAHDDGDRPDGRFPDLVEAMRRREPHTTQVCMADGLLALARGDTAAVRRTLLALDAITEARPLHAFFASRFCYLTGDYDGVAVRLARMLEMRSGQVRFSRWELRKAATHPRVAALLATIPPLAAQPVAP